MFIWIVCDIEQYLESFNFIDLWKIKLFEMDLFGYLTEYI